MLSKSPLSMRYQTEVGPPDTPTPSPLFGYNARHRFRYRRRTETKNLKTVCKKQIFSFLAQEAKFLQLSKPSNQRKSSFRRPIKSPSETPRVSRQYGTEECKERPSIVPKLCRETPVSRTVDGKSLRPATDRSHRMSLAWVQARLENSAKACA